MRWPRAFTLIEVVMIVSVMGLFGSMTAPRLWRAAEYLRYRASINEVASLVRISRHRAVVQQAPVELRVDAARERFQLVGLDARMVQTERVERTVWLPKGLEVADAPSALTIPPSGDVPAAQFLITAPAYHRSFRLITRRAGSVEIHEESSL